MKLFKKGLINGNYYAVTFTVTHEYDENDEPIMATYVAIVEYKNDYDNFISDAVNKIADYLRDDSVEVMELEGIFVPYETEIPNSVREIGGFEY